MVVGAREEEEWEGEKAVPVSSLRIQSSAASRRRADFANTPYINVDKAINYAAVITRLSQLATFFVVNSA